MGCLCVWSVAYAQTQLKEVNSELKLDVPKPLETNTQRVALRPTGNQQLHSIRASHQISEEALRQYLLSRGSPLADFAAELSASPYSSAIIAICTIEEYSCSVNPYGSNNLWGLMSNGHLIEYASPLDGIQAINDFLAKHEDRHPTIESMKGWYCQSACANWYPTVIKTKQTVENL